MLRAIAYVAVIPYGASVLWLIAASCGGWRNAFSGMKVGAVSPSSISMKRIAAAAVLSGLSGGLVAATMTAGRTLEPLSALGIRWLLFAAGLTVLSFLSAAIMTGLMTSRPR